MNTTYCYGDKIKIASNGTYIIANLGDNMISFICIDGLSQGNRWSNSVKIKNPIKITQQELNKILSGWKYEKVKEIL